MVVAQSASNQGLRQCTHQVEARIGVYHQVKQISAFSHSVTRDSAISAGASTVTVRNGAASHAATAQTTEGARTASHRHVVDARGSRTT